MLLAASLEKLDGSLSASREVRKKRREWRSRVQERGKDVAGGFLSDEMYDFEEVCSRLF